MASDHKPGTPDLFTAARGAEPLGGEWPEAGRFPLNHDQAHVSDVVLRDLRDSKHPLIVTGYAALDRLVDFIARAGDCESVRVVFGTEPYATGRERFAVREPELPEAMRDYWLERGISVLLSARVLECLEALKSGRVQARYVARSRWRLHAKIYVGDAAATVGSSNFTAPGLEYQLEANVRFEQAGKAEEKRRYRETRQIAGEIWNLGRDFNAGLIELLESLLRLVGWQEALARAAVELLEGKWAQAFLRDDYLPDDARLWPSQRTGIAQALYILKERGSVLVADATGSGKTRAGVHLIGAKMHEIVAANRLRQGKALVICPPSVVGGWEAESGKANVHVDVYSHGALSHARSGNRDLALLNLRRAQLLCVDEGHNFLNIGSNRTQQLLRNMADHVMLFTATPINRSAQDLLRIADMLGADNLDASTIAAFEKMLGVRSISRTLTDDEIRQLRGEIAKFTVRRTKAMLNELIAREPEAYRDAAGRMCRFPKHRPRIYTLDEPDADRKLAAEIRELAGGLKGVLHFRKPVALPPALKRRGVSEEQFLQGRLRAAGKLSQYMIMQSLRSSRAALIEHLRGTPAAIEACGLARNVRQGSGGNLVERVERIAGQVPKNRLSIELPDWLSDPKAHEAACREDRECLEAITERVLRMSDHRERVKAERLAGISEVDEHVLAFDTRPITLYVIRRMLDEIGCEAAVMVATGGSHSDRTDLLQRFSPADRVTGKVIGLCSDSVSEGVNLQRARVVVHLDMPSVVRIAEQRVGRIDRLDSPHKTIDAWWPSDAVEFALQSDERFIERYETVDNLLGSNMPLPEEVRSSSPAVSAREAIADFETHAGQWDGIEDAFSPVRNLVAGESPLVDAAVYRFYQERGRRARSQVSLVAAGAPWAFFCLADVDGIPKWILLDDAQSEPVTDLEIIAGRLRRRLGPETAELDTVTPAAERVLGRFLDRLALAQRDLMSRRKRRALEEMGVVLRQFVENAGRRSEQDTVDRLLDLLGVLEAPDRDRQPDWEEVAARWLDLIRPVWYEKLQDRGRRKPLLLRDIRSAVIEAEDQLLPKILRELCGDFPAQRPVDERIISCVVGVNG